MYLPHVLSPDLMLEGFREGVSNPTRVVSFSLAASGPS